MAISVEGQTEQMFIRHVIGPMLLNLGVTATPIIITTSREAWGRRHLGGSVEIQRVAVELKRLLGSHDYVTTFYDFYGLRGARANSTIDEAENEISQLAGGSRNLHVYLQRHEFEALLLVEPDILAAELDCPEIEKQVSDVVRRFGSPEGVNLTPNGAPSKRLAAWSENLGAKRPYSRRTKVRLGPQIAAKIGMAALRASCPRFNAWVSSLERFAKD